MQSDSARLHVWYEIGVTVQVPVRATLLEWACQRRGWTLEEANRRYPRFEAWKDGTKQPTLKQLAEFAKGTHTPIGYFFLETPPEFEVPIPDCRRRLWAKVRPPSTDMLETIFTCQNRQHWFRQYARAQGEAPLTFIGSANVSMDHEEVADDIRNRALGGPAFRTEADNWTEALRATVDAVESSGILVMINGIVGTNTHRPLDPSEFSGFALSDPFAPLIFVNGAESKAAQSFTIAHELAHLWLGHSALSGPHEQASMHDVEEEWCNKVAVEVLVPIREFQREFNRYTDVTKEIRRVARHFKVSSLVVIRRMAEAGLVGQKEMWRLYAEERDRIAERQGMRKKSSGGDYYPTQALRVSRRFGRAVYVAAKTGQTSYHEAMKLLNTSKPSTFDRLGTTLIERIRP